MFILEGSKKLFIFLSIAILFNACNFDVTQPVTLNEPSAKYLGSKLGQQFNNALLAEIYNQFGDTKLAVNHYSSLSKNTDDPAVLRRATELASTTGQVLSGWQLAKIWVQLTPNSLEARQYLALLQLRNKKYSQAAEQLYLIQEIVKKEKQSKEGKELFDQGLRFIGSMLSIESHHKKSFAVFQIFLERYGVEEHQTQQNLILASLAMKAKKYETVLSSFRNINNARTETIPEIVMMKAKALKNLKRVSEAVKGLEQYVENNAASDSVKLELVRLLIQDKQRNSAGMYLKALVEKHPDNNDLLKSLIALEIDQSELEHAKSNIQRLKQSEDHRSDAEYFTGEVLEAEGHLKNALVSYKKVKVGTLLKRAKKKIIALNKKLGQVKRIKVNLKKETTDSVE